MAGRKISELTQKSSLAGTEEIVVTDGGDNKRAPVSSVVALTGNATTEKNGLMSKEDKKKLDGLKNYILPAAGEQLGGVKIGDAVQDATNGTEKTTINALLTALRKSGVIKNS